MIGIWCTHFLNREHRNMLNTSCSLEHGFTNVFDVVISKHLNPLNILTSENWLWESLRDSWTEKITAQAFAYFICTSYLLNVPKKLKPSNEKGQKSHWSSPTMISRLFGWLLAKILKNLIIALFQTFFYLSQLGN